MIERDQFHQDDKRGLLDGVLGSTTGSSATSSPVGKLPSVPGSSALGLVKLENILKSSTSRMTTHQANIGESHHPHSVTAGSCSTKRLTLNSTSCSQTRQTGPHLRQVLANGIEVPKLSLVRHLFLVNALFDLTV